MTLRLKVSCSSSCIHPIHLSPPGQRRAQRSRIQVKNKQTNKNIFSLSNLTPTNPIQTLWIAVLPHGGCRFYRQTKPSRARCYANRSKTFCPLLHARRPRQQFRGEKNAGFYSEEHRRERAEGAYTPPHPPHLQHSHPQPHPLSDERDAREDDHRGAS